MESEVLNETNSLEIEFSLMEKNNLWAATYLQIRQESMKNEHSSDEAKKSDNKLLNRYRDVYPYDHSRIILSKTEYSYINASYISVEEARRKYILTQGPLSNTIHHFWLMVWRENSKAIIMLNKLIEKNQSKCCQYWPVSTSKEAALELPEVELRVELLRENTFSHYILREIRLTSTSTDESRQIIQFHYTTWPDFGVPRSPLAFLKFLRDVRQSDAFGFQYGPPIVHCSAGIGRSGTFCLVDSCLILMKEKGIEKVNVKNVLLEMRNYRMGLIQTPEQLRFSYIAIIQGLKVDWDAKNNDGLPEDNASYLSNGADLQNNGAKASDSEDEPPPLPPPRSFIQKPLPVLPKDSPSDSEIEDESESGLSDIDNEETRLIEDSSSEEAVTRVTPDDTDLKSNEPVLAGVSDLRKRQHSDGVDKSKRISEKVQEMKKKQVEAEKWKKIKSLFMNMGSGIGFVAVFGAALAYFWYRRAA
ncbi:hypothetical protein V9T40_000756 [Parthenolecanium corni]|uniref:protein-tyrosine-phosphatase n=1 Tax=Parthenolecanium corni TaxID=536013 RepID=A0AAN9TA58_9HEMI